MSLFRVVGMWCVVLCIALAPVSAQQMKPEMAAQFEQKTGLKLVDIPSTQGMYMGKLHRGYNVVFTAKMGNVWGRYAARLTAGEIGREVGGFVGYATGQGRNVGTGIVDSHFDRVLSEYLGQPITLVVALAHGRRDAPRLDILSDRAKVVPPDPQPKRDKIGANPGALYTGDVDFAAKVTSNAALMKRLKDVRDEYIRVDRDAVTFLFSGSEIDYSTLIRNHGDYFKMLNDLMDDLADIADAIPAGR